MRQTASRFESREKTRRTVAARSYALQPRYQDCFTSDESKVHTVSQLQNVLLAIVKAIGLYRTVLII